MVKEGHAQHLMVDKRHNRFKLPATAAVFVRAGVVV